MGSGQTARASSPATQHQILTRTLESSKAPVSPPQSGYTHPPHPPDCSFCPLPTQLFLTTGHHPKCPVSSLPLCLHPPHPTPPQPARLPTIVDLFMTLTVTRLLLKSLLPLSRTNKQSRRPQVTSCTFQLLHSFTFYIRSTPVHWLAFYYRADSPDLQPNPKQICPTAQPVATQAHPLSAFCADSSNYSIIILLILF